MRKDFDKCDCFLSIQVINGFYFFPTVTILWIGSPVVGVFTVWNREQVGVNRQIAEEVRQRPQAVNGEYEAESETGSDYADYYNLQQFER